MQKLNIGSTIKQLRLNKNITQDELAKFLGVSTPAISKWENNITYPDITLLSMIASYFNVSIDEIMSYRLDLTDNELDLIIKNCEKLIMKDIDKAVELFEEYLNQYSTSPKFKIKLSELAMLIYSKVKDINKIMSLNKRLISSLVDIIDVIADVELKEKALTQLSGLYMFNNDYENAKKYLEKIHKPSKNPDLLLPNILIMQKDFEEGRKRFQYALKNSLAEATSFSWQLGMSYLQKESFDIDRSRDYFVMAIKIRESENNLLNLSLPYIYLSRTYNQKGDIDTSINNLNDLIDKMSSFDMNEIEKYYDLIDKDDNEFNIKTRFKGVLYLINAVFSNDEILENEEMKNLIGKIESKIKSN